MQLTTTLALFAGTVASVSAAAPTPQGTAADTRDNTFTLVTRGRAPFDKSIIRASNGTLWVFLPSNDGKQDAQRNGGELEYGRATFFINEQQLYLYNGGENDSH
ncbi:hypothetical protein B0J18DRAFT_464601 [Chaetomium sp. MPI-SDFR-AT-0129]|nr:hypothetical protein B0J18DRAFT_464601 [Chaetomium sp. MPI-SDFR-AT-0129]